MGQSDSEKELLEIVASDLQFIKEVWGDEVDDHTIRRSSTILRRLLVENDLHQAWKISGFSGQATIVASTLEPITVVIPFHRIKFASAGGASYKGVQLRGMLLLDFALSDQLAKRLGEGPVPNKKFQLLEFIEDASVIVEGELVKRRQLIKFVANKLGGAHFDPSRSRRKEDRLFGLLEQVASSVELLEKPAIYFEMLSIGQSISQAEDISRLVDRIGEIV